MSTARRLRCAAVLLASAASATSVVAAPDVRRGEQLYVRCMACHALATDRVGPHHCGLLGRRAGSVPGFDYSAAMKRSKIVWTEKALNEFLASPLSKVPGTSMTYDGVAISQDRLDLIAYLARAGDSPECRSVRSRAR